MIRPYKPEDRQQVEHCIKAAVMDWIGSAVMLSLMVGLFVSAAAFWNRVGYGAWGLFEIS